MNVKPMEKTRPACYHHQKRENSGKRKVFYRVKIFSNIKQIKNIVAYLAITIFFLQVYSEERLNAIGVVTNV